MSIDDTVSKPANQAASKKDDPLVDLVDTLQKIDDKAPDAKVNETSMDDNNGERIEFNEGHQTNTIIGRPRLNPPSITGGTFFSPKKQF